MIRGIIDDFSLSLSLSLSLSPSPSLSLSLFLSRIPASRALSPDRRVKTLIGTLMSATRSSIPCARARDSYYYQYYYYYRSRAAFSAAVAVLVHAYAFTRTSCAAGPSAVSRGGMRKPRGKNRLRGREGRWSIRMRIRSNGGPVAPLDVVEYLLCRCRHTRGFKSTSCVIDVAHLDSHNNGRSACQLILT